MILLIIVISFVLIASGLTWLLLANDQGKKEPLAALWSVAGLGLLSTIVTGVIEHFLIPSSLLTGAGQPLGFVLLASLGVGCIEEACKFIPTALFLYHKNYFSEHVDGIIYFAIAGLAFAVPENILYTLQFGAGVGLVRIIMTPIFHAATTGTAGYFLAKAKVEHQSLRKPIGALAAVMLLHGLYDFGLSSANSLLIMISFMITASMSAVFFVLFIQARDLDRVEGLAVVGHNSFCRACGYPNPNHYLYCIRCGQRA